MDIYTYIYIYLKQIFIHIYIYVHTNIYEYTWSIVGGSDREIHFKIVGDTIPTVREKPVKSLGHLYSIPLTDHHGV